MIDAHCHLDFESFESDRREVLRRARVAGVQAFVVGGYDPEGWERITALCQAEPDVYGTLGLHPMALAEACAEHGEQRISTQLDSLLELLAAALDAPKIVGLGETGLDLRELASAAPRPLQERAFRAQIRMARRFKRPLVVHAVGAVSEALGILREERASEVGGQIHSFSGHAEQVPAAAKLGFYLSFGGPITYANARKAPDALRAVPEDRLLLETDAPDQPPEPHRRERGEPARLGVILRAAAAHRGCDPVALAAQTAANARRLFSIPETRP